MSSAVSAWQHASAAGPASGIARLLFVERGDSGDTWIYVISNACTAAALFAMALVLFQVMRKKSDNRLLWAAILAGAFFSFRGVTQLLGIYTQFHTAYRLRWEWTLAVSCLAVAMAGTLVWLLPVLHRIPSISDLEREIEERRRAEEEAIAKEERFRAFVESVEDYAIYMIDPQGTVLSWNQGAERMKGYSAEEIVGGNFARFYSDEDREAGKPERALQIAKETGRFQGEGWRVRKDGTRFRANVVMRAMRDGTGVLRGFSKVTRDLTESREMEAKYQLLLESVPNAIVIANRGGAIAYVNAEAEALFGWSRAEIVGQRVDVLVPQRLRGERNRHDLERDHEQNRGTPDDLRAAFASDPKSCCGLRKDGSEFPVEFRESQLETRDGGLALFAIQDLTERNKAADLLAQNMAALRNSNLELEQFAHIASHDLQEPLRMVASYLQLLARRYKGRLDGDADEFIDFAVNGTHRMKRLIEDLLKYSRVGRRAPPAAEVRSDAALREALSNLRTAIHESQAQVTWGALPRVTAEEVQLVQLFQNLVGNAIKYRGDRTPEIHISGRIGETGWIFSVADNGIGIKAEYFDRIFAIFQRLHGQQEYEGTGIGLAICKRILQQQGGRIWVDSEEGKGSTFSFELPFPEGKSVAAPALEPEVFTTRTEGRLGARSLGNIH